MTDSNDLDRRGFLKIAGAGVAAAVTLARVEDSAVHAQTTPRRLTEKEKFAQIASNTWPLRQIFKSRPGAPANPRSEEMKKKYGEITMLDMPQFTKDTFPGVTRMDLFSGLFGDVTDDSMYAGRTFDPSTPSGRKWLDRLAATMVKTGVKCQHISNNAPTNLAGPDRSEER